jgi:hypothetical protein
MAARTEYFTTEATMVKHNRNAAIIKDLFPPTHFSNKHTTKGVYLNYLLTDISKQTPFRSILFNTADLPNPFITVTCRLNDNHPALREVVAAIRATFDARVTTTTDVSGFEHFQFVVKSAVNASFTAFCDQFTQRLKGIVRQFTNAPRSRPIAAAPTPGPSITAVDVPVFALNPDDFTPLPTTNTTTPIVAKQMPAAEPVSPPVAKQLPAAEPVSPPVAKQMPAAEPVSPPVAKQMPAAEPVSPPASDPQSDDDDFITTISADSIMYIDANGQTRVKLPVRRIKARFGTKTMTLQIRDPKVTSIEHAVELFNAYASLRA